MSPAAPDAPYPASPRTSPHARHWRIDPSVCYLNHGSFGACPIPVLGAQAAYRDRMEADGVRWFVRDMHPLLDRARASLATLIDADPADLVFVPNATTGVATALAGLDLSPGDEVLTTDQEYPACMNNLHRLAERAGAAVVQAPLPWPIDDPAEVERAVLSRITDRTRACMLSHITSPTGLVLPVGRIVQEMRARGIATIIDGAHVPGQIPLSLRALDADFYAANCHKWVCSPKGSAVLHIRRDRQARLRPLVLSNHARTGHPSRPFLQAEFDYVGTGDITAWAAIHDAIEFLATLEPVGFPGLMERNRRLAIEARGLVCRALGVAPPAPEAMIPAMVALPLPPHEPGLDARLRARPTAYADALQDALIDRHGIQVPIWRISRPGGLPAGLPGGRIVRLSAQAYNAPPDYQRLASALVEELSRERAF